eukprot:scaffold44388_cov63-Phaeocystis_antarctica.AAC.7
MKPPYAPPRCWPRSPSVPSWSTSLLLATSRFTTSVSMRPSLRARACVCMCPLDRPNRPDCATLRETAPLCRVVLCPVEPPDRRHVHLGVHRRRLCTQRG